MQGKIFQLNIARNGGVPKTRVTDAMLTTNGLIGDAQAHPQTHGGAERALCLYSRERIEGLQGEGHPISPGSVGENVTIEGVDWNKIVPGVRLELGDVVVIEISKYNLSMSNDCSFLYRRRVQTHLARCVSGRCARLCACDMRWKLVRRAKRACDSARIGLT